MFAVSGTRDKPFVIGAQAGALRPLDLEREIAIEQVAELNVGQGEIVAAEIPGLRQLLLGDVEIAAQDPHRGLERVGVLAASGRADDLPENREREIERDIDL